MSETNGENGPADHEQHQGIPDEALPEDLRPDDDNPLADPDHEIGGEDDEDTDGG